jgi:DNA-binding NarL/FixJ family response regulator
MQEQPIVLILEDSPVTAFVLEQAILVHLPQCRPIWARNLEEARLRTASIPVDVFVVDIGLPDGSGLDFLWEMSAVHPNARALVMTGTPLPEHYAQSAALGALHVVEKPVTGPVIVEILQEALASSTTDASQAFQATLLDLTPLDLIQLKCLARATSMMQFTTWNQRGQLHFQDGEIIHAQVGDLTGVAALQEIFSWRRGNVRESAADPNVVATIECPWQSLLMQVAQAADEKHAH